MISLLAFFVGLVYQASGSLAIQMVVKIQMVLVIQAIQIISGDNR